MRHRARRRRRPALERVARARKRVRRQRLRRVVGHREIRHRAAAAVRVELHRVRVRLPDGIEVDRAVCRRRQVLDGRLVHMRHRTRRRGRPPLERVARARERIRRQRLRRVVGERLVRHRPRAAVRIELHCVCIRLVGRGQRHRASRHLERGRGGSLARHERDIGCSTRPLLERVSRRRGVGDDQHRAVREAVRAARAFCDCQLILHPITGIACTEFLVLAIDLRINPIPMYVRILHNVQVCSRCRPGHLHRVVKI